MHLSHNGGWFDEFFWKGVILTAAELFDRIILQGAFGTVLPAKNGSRRAYAMARRPCEM